MSVQATPAPAAVPRTMLHVKPPQSTLGVLRRLGPGLIIAGSIVGSGELIATTKVGAEAGFVLLWLIILGCLIKVFVQVEFGRYTIAEGRTTLEGLNQVPGPRAGVNWLVWYWIFMFSVMLGQLGGIVGGVGQTMALSVPITGDFRRQLDGESQPSQAPAAPAAGLAEAPGANGSDRQRDVRGDEAVSSAKPYTWDDVIWSAILTVITAVLLVNGRYGLIQAVATILVAGFTLITVASLFGLQFSERWAISGSDILRGLSFRLPESGDGKWPLNTALAAFGIIGVGAAELVAYPYWCLEKGYARFAGPRDGTSEWAERARGWLRVMRWDAWCSMVVYTIATIAFYLLGAAILHREGLNPAGIQLIRTLETMYARNNFFLGYGSFVFLVGAFAVLYSTFFVATAGNARIAADAVRLFGIGAADERQMRWWVGAFCGLFPFLSLALYTLYKDPVRLVLFSGLVQSIFLPMLGGAALFFRYRRCDRRICPGGLWDLFLWISVLGLLVTGLYGAYSEIAKLLA